MTVVRVRPGGCFGALGLIAGVLGGCGVPAGSRSGDTGAGSDAAPNVVDGGLATDAMGGQPGSATTESAPYFYAWGWGDSQYAFSSLAEMKAKGGPAAVTLAFVLSGGGCKTSTDIQDHLHDVQAYLAAGGHVKASFGGASGTYLEYDCSSATALAAALVKFVDATGITDLDFDLEQGSKSSNASLNAMRAAALKQLQDTRHVQVSFTLPIDPGGVPSESLDIVRTAVNAGVEVAIVNGMTMDYGDGTNLGTTPIHSIDSLARQLQGILPNISLAQAYRHAGATVMIGKNDDNETFSLDNARTLFAYARQKQLGLLSFWAIQRDQPCASGSSVDLCSRVNTVLFQFSNIFKSVDQVP